MGELDLYKFITEKGVEMRWDGDVLSTWIWLYDLPDFTEMIKSALDEDGIQATLRPNGVIYLDLVEVCEYYGIDPERIFPKPEEQ